MARGGSWDFLRCDCLGDRIGRLAVEELCDGDLDIEANGKQR
jgi:hypothetical protein